MPATAAQIAAARENSRKSTGPRTIEGKSKSARNSTKSGLFATSDFILPQDQSTYNDLHAAFWQDLSPEGPIEETLALEIIRASWRLQRCARAEAAYADRVLENALLGNFAVASTDPETLELEYIRVPYTPVDPLQDEAGQRFQSAIDRARASANNTFRRSLADLRRVQASREGAQQNEVPAPAVEVAVSESVPESTHQATGSFETLENAEKAEINEPAEQTPAAVATPANPAEATQPTPIHRSPATPSILRVAA